MKAYISKFVGIFLTVLLFAEPVCAKLVAVYGIDETGSYSFRNKAIALGQGIIKGLDPGDVFYARRITDGSYKDDCNVLRLELPEVGTPPQNKFDKRARHQWQRKLDMVTGLKVQASNALSSMAPVKAKRTDIWGFLAAAADRFKAECKGDCEKVIVIASDMKDNCNREVKMDLAGVTVIVAGFESGNDPALALKIKEGWNKSLKKYGVSAVEFLPPDCTLTLKNQPKEVQAQ